MSTDDVLALNTRDADMANAHSTLAVVANSEFDAFVRRLISKKTVCRIVSEGTLRCTQLGAQCMHMSQTQMCSYSAASLCA